MKKKRSIYLSGKFYKKSAFVLLLVLWTGFGMAQTDPYIQLKWSDEFEYSGAPDPVNWGYDLGGNGWGNNEVQYYTNNSQNVRVENGKLIIQAIKGAQGWTSARVKSQGKKSFTYGKIEFKAKLPQGAGTWPALWMLGENITTKNWPACGEIDVMEHVGKEPGHIHGSLHSSSSYGNTQNTGGTMVADYSTAFHTYAVVWTPDKIIFMVDGKTYYTYAPATKNASTWPFNDKFFFIMNIAMGGNWGSDPRYETNGLKNGIDPSLTSARMEVEYVRVYSEFTGLELAGERFINPGATNLQYKASEVVGAQYEWFVPADAVITAGEGTSSIRVNWGATEGDVVVKMTLNDKVYYDTLAVQHIVTPDTDRYRIYGFDTEQMPNASQSEAGNTYQLSLEKGALRINYQVAKPESVPAVVFTFDRPVNMQQLSILETSIKSLNKSKTLNMRIDLVDDKGVATTKSPVFVLDPLIDDGEYFAYSFDFANNWLAFDGTQVDRSKITQANLYIDYGIFGSAGQDSLWIDYLDVLKPSAVSRLPKRPSHAIAKKQNNEVVLSWKDQSPDESSFKIYRSEQADENFELLTEVSADKTSFTDASADIDKDYYYRVTAFNAEGESGFSNKAYTVDVVTGLLVYKHGQLEVFPNPAENYFHVILPENSWVQEAYLINALGRKVPVHSTVRKDGSLRIQPATKAASGFYLLHISMKKEVYVEKIILN